MKKVEHFILAPSLGEMQKLDHGKTVVAKLMFTLVACMRLEMGLAMVTL